MAEVLTGARAKFSLDGVKIGFATGVTMRESIDYEPINVLDNIETVAHEPIGYTVSLTADRIRIINTTLKSQGFVPKVGTDAATHLANILATGELTATLEDSKTGQVVAVVEGVKISEQSVSITARGVVGENVTFVARRRRDESDLP